MFMMVMPNTESFLVESLEGVQEFLLTVDVILARVKIYQVQEMKLQLGLETVNEG